VLRINIGTGLSSHSLIYFPLDQLFHEPGAQDETPNQIMNTSLQQEEFLAFMVFSSAYTQQTRFYLFVTYITHGVAGLRLKLSFEIGWPVAYGTHYCEINIWLLFSSPASHSLL